MDKPKLEKLIYEGRNSLIYHDTKNNTITKVLRKQFPSNKQILQFYNEYTYLQELKEIFAMNALGDVKRGSYAHSIFRAVGGNDGTIFFEDEVDILIGANAGRVINTFNMPPEEFQKLRKSTLV